MSDNNIPQSKIHYGEILFVGPCNLKCFYCLGHEMHKSVYESNLMRLHFSEWKNFKSWLEELREHNAPVVYLSSTNSEPLLYPYMAELIRYLQGWGFKVGIRTNGSLDTTVCNLCDEEISLSLQSFNPDTFKKITGVPLTFDFLANLRKIKSSNVRVSIVVNRYNKDEIFDMLDELTKFKLAYVQLRQRYLYYWEDTSIEEDQDAINEIGGKLYENYKILGRYKKETLDYDYKGMKVSLWWTVFSKKAIMSSNYWTNGKITHNNLLIEGYEECRQIPFTSNTTKKND